MMLRGTRADNEMFRWEPNDTPTSSMSSEDQSRAFANRTKKKCKPLLALKLILPFCILFLAVANVMPMHHPVMTQDIENLARKAEFFEKEAFNFRDGVNAGKINDENSGIGSNNRDFGSNEIRMQQFAQDLLVRQDQSRKNSSFAKVIFNLSNIDQYPSALHPITFPKCCPILSVPKSRHHPPCDTVCYTEQACNNELYPYSSKENRSFLSRRIVENKTDKLRIREPCNEMNSLRKPQYQWCQHWKIRSVSSIDTADHNVTNKKYSIDPYAAKLPPPGCSTLESGGGSGSYQHVILFPQAKLAFCGIPKSGLTRWLQFLRFTFGAKDYQGFPHMKPEVAAMRFDKLREQTQMEILNDPEWKFAAILRNPAERLLSAYLDKVASKKAGLRKSFQNTYGLNYTISFEEFVNYLGEERQSCPVSKKNEKIDGLRGVDWCANPHWRPQTFFCGLSEFLPRFSFIGSLDHVEHQSRALLQSVGLWESYGKYYHWVDDKKEMKGAGFCRVQPPELRNGQELIGFQQRMRQHFASNNETQNNATAATNNNTNEVVPDIIYGHSTDSRSKVDSYYSSPELLEKVHMLYEGDFKLWDLIKDKDSLSSGDELAAALSPECRILRESGNGHKEIFSDKKIRTEGFT